MLKKKNKKQLISLSEASELVPGYSQEYLSLRVRQGKLKGQKIGRNWYTKIEWIKKYINELGIKEVAINSSKPSSRVLRGDIGWIAARFKKSITPTRVLATALSATIAFAFIAPPSAWAKWGVYASSKAGQVLDLAVSGTAQGITSLAESASDENKNFALREISWTRRHFFFKRACHSFRFSADSDKYSAGYRKQDSLIFESKQHHSNPFKNNRQDY